MCIRGRESGWNGKFLQAGGDLMQVKSTVKMNFPRIRQLTQGAVTALELTAEALHTEVVQAQVFPFDTGNLQNESTFVDTSAVSYTHLGVVPGGAGGICTPSGPGSGGDL